MGMLKCLRKKEGFLLHLTIDDLYRGLTQGCLGGGSCCVWLPILLHHEWRSVHWRTVSAVVLSCVCVCVCALTVMSKEIAVDDVNQTVQLLFHQATQRNLQDELGEQLAAETGGEQWRKKKVKLIGRLWMVDCFPSRAIIQDTIKKKKVLQHPHRYFSDILAPGWRVGKHTAKDNRDISTEPEELT